MIPVIDLGPFLGGEQEGCQEVADALHRFGCLVVRDQRVDASANDTFLDMMEQYFEESDGVLDARPHLHYQVGVTPSGVEHARNHCEFASKLPDKPISDCPPIPDAKWRFFWRIGERPSKTEFEELNAPQVVPKSFQGRWEETMDTWGKAMVAAAKTVAEMAAVGFGMESQDSISSLMDYGPHLLAPTGSDLSEVVADDSTTKSQMRSSPHEKPKLGTILASFHYDLNLLTVHGRSRFPGLTIWTRDGQSLSPVVPPGCLLVQAGKQMELLTNNHVLAGFHEVIATEKAAIKAQEAKQAEKSTWRVSSTCFAHVASDNLLQPLPPFNKKNLTDPPVSIKAGDQVRAELEAISLSK